MAALWIAVVLLFVVSAGYGQPPTLATSRPVLLSSIKNLQRPVDLVPKSLPYSSLFRVLSRESRLGITSKDSELIQAEVFIGYQSQPIHAVMDAIAAMFLCQWEENQNVYLLLPGRRFLDDSYAMGDENKRARLEAGWEFISTIENTPNKEVYFSPTGLPFTSFPKSLHNSLRQMVAAMHKQVSNHPGIDDLVAKLDESSIVIRRKVGITDTIEYFVKVRNSTGSMGFRIHNHEDPKRTNNSGNGGNVNNEKKRYYPTEKFEVSIKDAKNHPMLRKTVNINLRGYTFPLVMRHLHQEYGIPFITELPKTMPQKANVTIGPVPLGEALDYLTSVYKNTEWELRKSGFVIVRGPTHPGRDAFQGKGQGEVKGGQ